jgi:hypothetical protein
VPTGKGDEMQPGRGVEAPGGCAQEEPTEEGDEESRGRAVHTTTDPRGRG